MYTMPLELSSSVQLKILCTIIMSDNVHVLINQMKLKNGKACVYLQRNLYIFKIVNDLSNKICYIIHQ